MKDPLQQERTPYEILGLERGASAAEIEQAFKQGLLKRGNVQKLTAAKLTLQRPAERALLDLFQYDPAVLARLTPNPLEQAGALGPTQREATAAAWERQLRANFPDVGIAQGLGLLWYWWAVYEENAPAGTGDSEAGEEIVFHLDVEEERGSQALPPSIERWERAIGYWGMVIVSEEFWAGQGGLPPELAGELRTALVDRLRNQIHEYGQHYRRGQEEIADRYQELELAWSTELRTAKDVASAGVRTNRGKIACGRLLLQQMGLLETVRKQVATALQKNPTNTRLKSLEAALSPYSTIGVLLDHKKPQAALEAIAALPKEEQEKEEVQRLRVRAGLEWGRQQASLGKIQEALDAWAEALGRSPGELPNCPSCGKKADEELPNGKYWCGSCNEAFKPRGGVAAPSGAALPADLEQEIHNEIVSTCQARAVALQRHQAKEAIAILKKALRLVSDEKLQLTLAEILTQQGIQAINEAQRRLESEKKGVTPEIMAALESGLADLKQAAQLGSKRAAENVEIAQNVLQQAKSGLLDVSPEVGKLLRQANEEASADRWNEAISLLRRAVKLAGSRGQTAVREQLVQCLNAQAVQQINRAMKTINELMGLHQAYLRQKAEEYLSGFFVQICVQCRSNPAYNFDVPGLGQRSLCSNHASGLREILEASPPLDLETSSTLFRAAANLEEAARLDPASDQIRKNLNEVREIISRFKVEKPAATKAAVAGKAKAAVRKEAGSSAWRWLAIWWLLLWGMAIIDQLYHQSAAKHFLPADGIRQILDGPWARGGSMRVFTLGLALVPFLLRGLVEGGRKILAAEQAATKKPGSPLWTFVTIWWVALGGALIADQLYNQFANRHYIPLNQLRVLFDNLWTYETWGPGWGFVIAVLPLLLRIAVAGLRVIAR